MKCGQGILYRLGLQLELFPDDSSERAFLGAPKMEQARIIATALEVRDRAAAEAAFVDRKEYNRVVGELTEAHDEIEELEGRLATERENNNILIATVGRVSLMLERKG